MVIIWIVWEIDLTIRVWTNLVKVSTLYWSRVSKERGRTYQFMFRHGQYWEPYCDINKPTSSVILKPLQYCKYKHINLEQRPLIWIKIFFGKLFSTLFPSMESRDREKGSYLQVLAMQIFTYNFRMFEGLRSYFCSQLIPWSRTRHLDQRWVLPDVKESSSF